MTPDLRAAASGGCIHRTPHRCGFCDTGIPFRSPDPSPGIGRQGIPDPPGYPRRAVALVKGAEVCRPTICSLSLSIYPAHRRRCPKWCVYRYRRPRRGPAPPSSGPPPRPTALCPLGRRREKPLIPVVGCHITGDKVPHIHHLFPDTRLTPSWLLSFRQAAGPSPYQHTLHFMDLVYQKPGSYTRKPGGKFRIGVRTNSGHFESEPAEPAYGCLAEGGPTTILVPKKSIL